MKLRSRLFVPALGCAFLCCACGSASDGEEAFPPAPQGDSPALVSDWLNYRLDLVDLADFEEGAAREDVLLASLDLSGYAQGPINAEVTPDGKTALVALSAGFFAVPFAGTIVGENSVPMGPGRLLFIDLETFRIVGELETGNGPMGIGISKDGKTAVIPHFGEKELTVVDIENQSIVEKVDIGLQFGEEIAYDDTGSVGIVAYSSAGNILTFAVDDVSGSLGPGPDEEGDAAGVAFFPGTKTAFVVQAPMPLLGARGGYDVVDVSDPTMPTILSGERWDDAPVAYPAAPVPSRGTVVVPTAQGGVLGMDEWKLNNDGTVEKMQSFELGEASLFGAYGTTVDAEGRAWLSAPVSRDVIVVDLEAGTHFSVPWDGSRAGPMDVALIPTSGSAQE